MNLKEKLQAGQKVYGTMIRIARNPAVCCLAKNAGLDFVLFDCEHSGYSFESLHDMFMMCNNIGLSGCLRVPELTRDNISRSLDCGAEGVMVPMTETAEQARDIVKWSKYQPVGNRGFCSGGANVNYGRGMETTVVMKEANKRILSIAQIETKLAVDNADSIAATNGIDVLLIGPNDLSLSLDIPGDLMNPIEIEAIAHVAAACKKHGKAFGIHSSVKLLKVFAEDLNFIMSLHDMEILSSGFSKILEDCRQL
jgi:2,4-dihydroxyhept-2-ene-1,7-dioic acid aldolase